MAEGPPVKEVKTVRREGSSTIEEYERLNQDGTVTKIVTVEDQNTGRKHYDVYKMDKSGIVRKVNSADEEGFVSLKEASDAKYEWFKRQMADSQNMASPQQGIPKDNQPYTGKQFPVMRQALDGTRIIEPQDEFLRLIRDSKTMSPAEKMAVFNKYKEKLIDYGTNKLQNVLKQKLDGNHKLSGVVMSDEQKNNLIGYGVKKMKNLLLNDLNEELFFSEILPRYERETLSYPNPAQSQPQTQNQINQPISFNLQPGSVNVNDQKGRRISFTIRPEEKKPESINEAVARIEKEIHNETHAKPPETEKSLEQQKREEVIKFALKGMKNTTKESEDEIRRINEESYERRKNNPLLHAMRQYGEQQKQKEEQKRPAIQYKFSEPHLEPRAQVKELETKKKRNEVEAEADQFEVTDVIDYLGERLRTKPREEMTNKKYDKMINKVFDEEEIFSVGLRVLRKMLKKRHEEEAKEFDEFLPKPIQKEPKGCYEHLTKQQSKSDEGTYGGRRHVISAAPEKESPKPKKRFDWSSLLSPFQDMFSDPDTNENKSNQDNKPKLKSNQSANQSAAEEKQRFTFDDLLSKVRKTVAQTKTENTSSSRDESRNEGMPYQSWRASGSEQDQEKEKTSFKMEDLLNLYNKAFSQKDESHSAANGNTASRQYQVLSQQNNNNDEYQTAQRKPISFRIQPQVSGRIETPIERTNTKPSSDGNVPWWFDGTPGFMTEPLVKTPPVKKPPAVGGSFDDSSFLNVFDSPLLSGP